MSTIVKYYWSLQLLGKSPRFNNTLIFIMEIKCAFTRRTVNIALSPKLKFYVFCGIVTYTAEKVCPMEKTSFVDLDAWYHLDLNLLWMNLILLHFVGSQPFDLKLKQSSSFIGFCSKDGFRVLLYDSTVGSYF